MGGVRERWNVDRGEWRTSPVTTSVGGREGGMEGDREGGMEGEREGGRE